MAPPFRLPTITLPSASSDRDLSRDRRTRSASVNLNLARSPSLPSGSSTTLAQALAGVPGHDDTHHFPHHYLHDYNHEHGHDAEHGHEHEHGLGHGLSHTYSRSLSHTPETGYSSAEFSDAASSGVAVGREHIGDDKDTLDFHARGTRSSTSRNENYDYSPPSASALDLDSHNRSVRDVRDAFGTSYDTTDEPFPSTHDDQSALLPSSNPTKSVTFAPVHELEVFDGPAGVGVDSFQRPTGKEIAFIVTSVIALVTLAVAAGLTTIYNWVL